MQTMRSFKKNTCICSFVQKKYQKDKAETNEVDYVQGEGRNHNVFILKILCHITKQPGCRGTQSVAHKAKCMKNE